MKKVFQILLWSIGTLILVLGALIAVFMYKVKYGFPVTFETEAPAIEIPSNQTTILLFSKTTGFRHEESIEAGKRVFSELAAKNNWFLFETEEGGLFNLNQLEQFDVVVFNNSTGRVLNDEQQVALEAYVAQGGSLIGIHGAGDDSHRWEWYEANLLGSKFSHHPLNPQLQETQITLNRVPDTTLVQGLQETWTHTDEWYIFFENPSEKGFNILYTIDGERINPNGNLLWILDKDFGMGTNHPVAWYRQSGKGRTFYTSIGHNAQAWNQPNFVQMIKNAIE